MQTRATYSWMLGVFAGLALLLALGGAYGVTSYLVTQRTREIGIRMALGARANDIMRAVAGGSFAAIGVGVVSGLGAAVLTGGLLGDLLFGVSPRDPMILSIASTHMKMTPAEGIAAVTINAAYSLNRGAQLGSLEAGKIADFVIHDCDDYRELAYFFGIEHPSSVYVRGQLSHG